ncbi:immortalization up-regulated protein isoform X1 [Gorilla gorilla gorilla]|uniref:immortalization up-regulated protein isoform X1 n=1 Tax=Gorilla gorilla gorilla TaxID=9595 RepID=UPI00300BB720
MGEIPSSVPTKFRAGRRQGQVRVQRGAASLPHLHPARTPQLFRLQQQLQRLRHGCEVPRCWLQAAREHPGQGQEAQSEEGEGQEGEGQEEGGSPLKGPGQGSLNLPLCLLRLVSVVPTLAHPQLPAPCPALGPPIRARGQGEAVHAMPIRVYCFCNSGHALGR